MVFKFVMGGAAGRINTSGLGLSGSWQWLGSAKPAYWVALMMCDPKGLVGLVQDKDPLIGPIGGVAQPH